MARKTQQRSLRQPEITIIGEGATERFYFTNLRRLKGYRYTCKPRNFTEQSLDEILKQVERVLADRGIAVCVFDTDITRNNPTERAKFEALCQKYKDRKDVIICDSMPSKKNGWQTYWQTTALKQPSNVPRHLERRENHTAIFPRLLRSFPRLLRSLKTSNNLKRNKQMNQVPVCDSRKIAAK